ncbi:MAG: WD40/YVTN/BNR-like repeat-containing protein [Candidatus Methylomirabilaceae bacterium]
MRQRGSEATGNARGKPCGSARQRLEGTAGTGRLARLSTSILALVLAVSALELAAEERGLNTRTGALSGGTVPRLPGEPLRAVAQARSGTKRLYAATATGLLASEDGGRRWVAVRLPPAANVEVLAVAVDPRDERTLYVGGRGGLWKSPDAGSTWTPIDLPSRSMPRALAVGATTPAVLYVGTDRDGVFRSPDGGVSWVPASRGLPEALAGGRPALVRSLTAHPTNPELVYAATELHGLYRTMDGGATWAPINEGLGPLPLRRRTGGPRLLLDPLDPQRLLALVIRPVHSHRLDTRLFHSGDGGERWLPLEIELSREEQGVALAVDPADPKGVWLFTTRGVLPVEWPRRAQDVRSGPAR